MIEIILAVGLGVFIGIGAGLLPGVHPNNVIPVIASLALMFGTLEAAVILVSSGIVNSFVSMIPSVLLGAPEDSDALGVLPGHKLLLEGRGFEAIKLTVVGSLGGMFFSMAALLPLALFLPPVYSIVKPFTHYLLLFILGFMIFSESGNRIGAILLALLSGVLGILSLGLSGNMIFPLLSGLFGLPLLLLSIFKDSKLPDVFSLDEEKIPKKQLLRSIGSGSLAGLVTGLIPGIGSAQATILAQQVSKSKGEGRDFLLSIGAVTTSNVIYSLLALWLIGKARSGIAIAVGEILEIDLITVVILLSVIIISSGIAAYTTLKLSKPVLFLMKKVNYKILSGSIFSFVLILVLIFSGPLGLVVTLVSLSIGLIPNFINVRRSHCMSCLMIPTIFYYFGVL